MKQKKLISEKIIRNEKEIIFNRRIIEYDPEKLKTPEEKYREENIHQFYDWIIPNLSKPE